jgi:hypothetical protein
MDSAMSEDKLSATNIPGWNLVPRFLVWLGGSTGAIVVVLSALGFLVEHAYFDRLGIPRTLYQATPHEYTITGGKFLMGIVPLAFVGALHFCLNYWWLALLTLLLGGLIWWKNWFPNARWLLAAAWLALSLALLALRLQQRSSDSVGVGMFTFVVAAALAFIYVEVFFLGKDSDGATLSQYASRAPFVIILVCAIVALPYLRGYYAQDREYPVVQFLAKDKTFFCDLSASKAPDQAPACAQESWQIIDIGADRAIVRRVLDSKIYVIPASSITTFKVLGKELAP